MPKTSLQNKKSNAMNNVATQIKRMAKKGKMPTALVGGTAADQIKAFEAIQDSYPTTPAMQSYLKASSVSDQPNSNRWYIRTPNGGVSVMTYPQGASDKAKQGALKMFAWNKTKNTQAAPTAKPVKWSRTSMVVKDQQGSTEKGYSASNGKAFIYKMPSGLFKIYDVGKGRTLTQGHGVGLSFGTLKEAKAYALKKIK